MNKNRCAIAIAFATLFTVAQSLAAPAVPGNDPLAAIDLNRNAIIADIVQGFAGDRDALAKRLAALRADRLLAVSLASTSASVEAILTEAEKSRDAAVSRASAKVLGSGTADLVYTPLTPCRLIDTRGFGAPIQGGAFAPNARRGYVPQGLCGLPTANVASILISFTTENLTPNSGGYLAILAPNAAVTASVDVFNLGAEWSASNTAVATGPAAQFDVLVAVANAHVVIDVLGYFAPPQGGVVTSITAGTGLTGGTITSTGTVGIASAFQLPQVCTNGQVATSNGAGVWTCATPVTTGGTVTGVTATAPIASSGGIVPNISLAGPVSPLLGGTGQSTLAVNGVLFGQGAAAVGSVTGTVGDVLVGTAGAPAWSGSPSLSGNLSLAASSPTAGNILKGATRFMHNFGTSNTFAGLTAGNLALTGTDNAGLGTNALKALTSGGQNVAAGSDSLALLTTGGGNVALGSSAMSKSTTATSNTAVGNAAFANSTSGSFNVLVGAGVGLGAAMGDFNTIVGTNSFGVTTTATQNTGVGGGVLDLVTTGVGNTALGFIAGSNITTGSFNISIGNQGVSAESGAIRIGNFQQSKAFIAGIRGVTTTNADAVQVFIDSAGQLGTVSSSRRFKDDIADMDAASSALMKLRPVTFHYKSDTKSLQRKVQYGLIAEEVAEVYPGLVAHSADGQVETVMYQYLPTMLLNEVQKQQRAIEALSAEVAELKKQTTILVRLLDQQHGGAITAGLDLK